MGETFLIVSERPVGGTNLLFTLSGALSHCLPVGVRRRPGQAPFRHLDALAQEVGVRPLSEFVSEDPETAGWRFFGDVQAEPPPDGLPTSRWFTAAEGLETVRGLLDYLTTHTETVAEVRKVLGDLRQIEQVLADLEEEGVSWHLEDVSWW